MSDLLHLAEARPDNLPPGAPPLLTLSGIAKYFPGVIANKDVTIDFYPGEIHALLGENGAGKSTLMNIVTGLYQPDEGELILDGYGVRLESPEAAIAAGIGMVHQHFKLVSRFTVAENLALGWRETGKWLSAKTLARRAEAEAARFGLDIRPQAPIDSLTSGEQQRVEILRVLSRGARLLILDEPTAVLSPLEVGELYAALRRFRDGGGAVILISHKLDEIMALADRVTVLRHGRVAGSHRVDHTDPATLVTEMIGRPVEQKTSYPRTTPQGKSETVIRLHEVSFRDSTGRLRLHPLSLDIRAGEILGVAGVTGNGQSELADLLAGLNAPLTGSVHVGSTDMRGQGPGAFREAGIGYVPEDRLHKALAPALGVTENAVMRVFRSHPVGGRMAYHASQARAFTKSLLEQARVAVQDPSTPMRGLSGGNQQRMVLARERMISHRALIASYPSRGLDIGAISLMRETLAEIRDEGRAVVLVSEDLDELMALSDRIAVLCAGMLMTIVERKDFDRARLGALMSGRAGETAA
ncbi:MULTISPECIES: ABC transporter ATP-binding protein [Asaia]|uniref:ABC transporter ATP-binding protein n=1 Tax=Asaia TaxID=91914 RepID=UPI002555D65A|nr:ABC transporter ATP-binding protein [Asaia sp. HumB]MDL2169613.1 ABC transporter ATP-binding protein [Asaia sp. HumB]